MLKAMIMMKFTREDNDGASLSDEELHAYGQEQLNTLIEESVKFCNDGKKSQELKARLGDVLKCRKEVDRCQPLTVALNTILLDFTDKTIGALQRCAPKDETPVQDQPQGMQRVGLEKLPSCGQ